MLVARVTVLLLAVVCSLAQEPRRCCFDKQYSVKMKLVGMTLTDNPNFFDADATWGFDFYTDRQGFRRTFHMQDGSTTSNMELKDFAARRVYYTGTDGNCNYRVMEDYEVNRPFCIPDEAIYLGPSVIGYGHQSMNLHTWGFDWKLDNNQTSHMVLSVTRDHCVPIAESVIGVYEGVPLEEAVAFTDYTPGIENLHRLEPPQNCQPQPTMPSGK